MTGIEIALAGFALVEFMGKAQTGQLPGQSQASAQAAAAAAAAKRAQAELDAKNKQQAGKQGGGGFGGGSGTGGGGVGGTLPPGGRGAGVDLTTATLLDWLNKAEIERDLVPPEINPSIEPGFNWSEYLLGAVGGDSSPAMPVLAPDEGPPDITLPAPSEDWSWLFGGDSPALPAYGGDEGPPDITLPAPSEDWSWLMGSTPEAPLLGDGGESVYDLGDGYGFNPSSDYYDYGDYGGGSW